MGSNEFVVFVVRLGIEIISYVGALAIKCIGTDEPEFVRACLLAAKEHGDASEASQMP